MPLTLRRRNVISFDPERIAEQLILNSELGHHIYLCEDGELKYYVPCSEDGKRTLVTFYVKDEKMTFLKELDKDIRTPLLEEVEREFKRSVQSLIEEVKNLVDSAINDFYISKQIYKYDIYLGEGLVPIGEATGVLVRVNGEYELKLDIRDKTISMINRNMGKLRELINKWENNMRTSTILKKIEKYEPKIDNNITGFKDKFILITGGVTVDIPIASEGLLTAINLVRESQNDKSSNVTKQ
ncbi:MAG: hypothetical protein QXS16_02260 [Pyrobaculum sp.]